MHAHDYLTSLAGKRIAVCGIGRNNLPVIRQLVGYGALVTACDRRSREELGQTAKELGAAGAAGDLCADGALGARTAHLREPYRDAPAAPGAARSVTERWQSVRWCPFCRRPRNFPMPCGLCPRLSARTARPRRLRSAALPLL